MAGPAILQLSEALCATRFDGIPTQISKRAADCILDALGSGLAGRSARSTRAIQTVMAHDARRGAASVWFTNLHLSPIPAATINAMAATALDIDDGHRRIAGHPGAAVIAAALAVAEELDTSMTDLISAVVVGYEAAVRVALARNPEHHSSTVSGRWSGVGAAAAAAWLRKVKPSVMAEAILIAEQHAPRVSSAMYHGFAGSDVKEAIAWSVQSGLYATELAGAGFTGYPDTFDQGILYDAITLCRNLDRFDAIKGLFFKPYACCRWIHSAIDGLSELMQVAALQASDINDVHVRTFRRAVSLGNHVSPKSEAQAQFSIPFCLGVVAVHGAEALTPIDPALLQDTEVRSFARKVRVDFDAEIDSKFPELAPAKVAIISEGKTFDIRVDAAFGDPTNPMSRRDLQNKFTVLTRGLIASDRRAQLVTALEKRAAGSVRDVLSELIGN